VREIEALYRAEREDLETEADLLDIEAEIEVGNAIACGFNVRGLDVRYLAGDQQLVVGRTRAHASLPMANGRIRLRLLLDRTSLEIFANDGRAVISTCFLPEAARRAVRFFSCGGRAKLTRLRVRELASAWPDSGAGSRGQEPGRERPS
jgi:sucrose-6-phosphate hydrolase SacC (GH32 family)